MPQKSSEKLSPPSRPEAKFKQGVKMSGNGSSKELFEGMLQAFMSKDLPKVMSYFTDDAVLYDPHYPQPRMVGKAAIQQGLEWGMSSLEKPGFKLRHMWTDENSGVAELDTHHLIKGGIEAKFDQVFVFEVRDGKFTRLQSYVPYPPHGIAGIIGNVTKVMWRLQGKMK
jgi:ketosteroid isomerase-like protein